MNLSELLHIKSEQITQTKIIISLEVTDAVKQPYGIMHGGINAVLAETAASLGANENLPDDRVAVGVDITTHHLRPVSHGKLVTTATPVHIGNTLQTWYTETVLGQQLISISTVTLSNVPKPK
ncbi:PaaI family thioesterase [Secundilactobacillus folii]|uniref:Hotdog fold thioesterase n=1 Tax=Secundilactobacillus folii TaxID=2678357 RepID=A0A7X2XW32_9LACO|nr:PaaI family thioesterase [Secundilactobacillus folii]MTV82748.1 hotdog fold thioesterase [Secundilactobacillus folii]